jgi:CDP-glucose 4,6-dehydratase
MSKYWNFNDSDNAFTVTDNIEFHEATLLKLNCDKSLALLKWQATLGYQDTIKFTSEWYYDYYKNNGDMMLRTTRQIGEYANIAKSKSLTWTV